MDGTFAPGEQLGEALLADNLNCSRGPVREALQRLAQEGLVRNLRNRGTFVTSLTEGDVREIYGARLAIERSSIIDLCRGRNSQVLDRLQTIVNQMATAAVSRRWGRLADIDLQFHTVLVQASENMRLSRMFGTLIVETRMCLNHLEPAYPEPSAIVDEHMRILEAISSRNASKALPLMDAHLLVAVEQIVQTLTARTVGGATNDVHPQ
jgi:DNA-binding GntR family transcriptional regulator